MDNVTLDEENEVDKNIKEEDEEKKSKEKRSNDINHVKVSGKQTD